MVTHSFRQLRVWDRAHQLVLLIYRITTEFPQEERYGLISQMRRAAVSVAANIVEGYKRRGAKEKARFYNIAGASLEELRYYFILGDDLGFTNKGTQLEQEADEIAGMLHRLIRKLGSSS